MTITTIAKSPAGKVARSTPAVDAAETRSTGAGEAGAISPASAPPPTEFRSRDDHHMYLSFDRAFKAKLARLTFGLSPAVLAEQTFDWLAHLVISQGKQLQLIEKAFRDAARFGIYAAQSVADPGTPLCISALPQDRRFQGEAWQQWPYNLIYQPFLLSWLISRKYLRRMMPF